MIRLVEEESNEIMYGIIPFHLHSSFIMQKKKERKKEKEKEGKEKKRKKMK